MKKFKEFSSKDHGSNIFVRWGGANAVRQKGEKGESISWHAPPDSRGIYAFPLKGIERFLSGHRMKERYSRIKYTGEIWHHLINHVKVSEIIKRQGSWVLTEFKTWEKAFKKEMLEMKLKGWSGKINNDADDIGKMTTYWRYYMRHRFSYYIETMSRHLDPIIEARIQRYKNEQPPNKEDLNDEDFLEFSKGRDDDKGYHYSYTEWLKDSHGNTRGGYSGDHLEVFLPNVK